MNFLVIRQVLFFQFALVLQNMNGLMLAASFLIIVFLALCLFHFGIGKDRLVLSVSMVWILLIGGISATGYFENTTTLPPRFPFVLIFSVALACFGYRKLKSKPASYSLLLAVHSLRLPVELVLYRLYLSGEIPVLMTFQGWNLDILMGISALLLLLFRLLSKREIPHRFLIAWNICGIGFLATIAGIAILSSPLPVQQWAFDQPNVALIKFPFVLLPAYLVPVVFLSHFLMLKKLFSKTN